MKDCWTWKHDYENAIRKWRANYECPKCKKDISIELVYLQEALTDKK